MKKLTALFLAIVMVFALCACGGGDDADKGGDEAEVINWDYLSIISTTNPAMKPIVDFVNEVEEATDGRLVITIREPGELPFKNSEYVRAIGEGSAEMGWGLMPAITGDLKSGSVLGLPFLVQNSEELTKAMTVLEDALKEELNAYGTDMLFYFNMPAQNLFGQDEPIKNFADTKSMLIRASGAEMADFVKSLGAVPVTVDSAEVPTSLSRGVIESAITSALNCYGSNWNESLTWGYMFDLQVDTIVTLVNQQALNDLPEDIREILLEVSAKYTDLATKAIAEAEQNAVNELEKGGMTIIKAEQADIDAQIDIFSSYWDEWAASKDQSVQDALKEVREALGK